MQYQTHYERKQKKRRRNKKRLVNRASTSGPSSFFTLKGPKETKYNFQQQKLTFIKWSGILKALQPAGAVSAQGYMRLSDLCNS